MHIIKMINFNQLTNTINRNSSLDRIQFLLTNYRLQIWMIIQVFRLISHQLWIEVLLYIAQLINNPYINQISIP